MTNRTAGYQESAAPRQHAQRTRNEHETRGFPYPESTQPTTAWPPYFAQSDYPPSGYPPSGYPPAAGYPDFPDARPQERDATSVHAVLVGSIVTISIAIGLASSLWINHLGSKPHAGNPLDLALLAPKKPAENRPDNPNRPDENPPARELNPPEGIPPLAALKAPENSASRTGFQQPPEDDADGNIDAAPAAAIAPSSMTASNSDAEALPVAPAQKPKAAEKADAPSQAAPQKPSSARETRTSRSPAATAAAAKKKPVKAREPERYDRYRKPAVKVANKDGRDEIDRLKSQAFSETWRERLNGEKSRSEPPASEYQFLPESNTGRSANTAPPPSPSRISSVQQELARCQRNASFFVREQCKWRLCDGQWGKNGCPSYETKSAAY